jgi:hypothetical protein
LLVDSDNKVIAKDTLLMKAILDPAIESIMRHVSLLVDSDKKVRGKDTLLMKAILDPAIESISSQKIITGKAEKARILHPAKDKPVTIVHFSVFMS